MDPSTVQDEQHHVLDSQQVTHGTEEEDVAHPPDLEKKSYMTRVKAKARKIKDSIKKHYGHNESNSEYDEEPHTPDHDHDHHLDEEEDKEMFEDPEVHEKPINEREVVKSATPASEQVETLHKPGNDFEFQGTKVVREEQPHQDDSLVEPAFSTTDFNHKIHDIPTTTDPAKTFSAEKKPEVLDEDLHEKGSRPEEYTLPNYQTKVADRSEAGSDDLIEDITPVQEPHYDPLVEGINSTTDINQNLVADPIKTFAGEEKPEYNKFNSERPNVLEENLEVQGSRPEAYTHPNYQTKISDDASGDGSDEIKDFKGVEESFERMNVHDKPTFADTEYPPAKNHDQSVPSFSAETKTQNEYPRETLSTDINTNPQIPSETRETFINIADFNSNSEAVEKSATPASEKDKNLGESGIDFEGTKAVGEGHHQYPLAEGVSSTTEINQKPEEYKFKLEEPIVLQEGSHEQGSRAEAYDLPNYQTEVTDPRGAGSDEIKDIAKIEDSFERMNVNNEPTDVDHEYLNKNHDQFVPHLSDATKTRDEYPQGTVSSDINTSPEIPSETRENFNNITTAVEEEQPLNESVETQFKHKNYTDEIETLPANSEASRLHYDEKGDRNKVEETREETDNASNLSGSNVEYGKNTVPSVTENLAPVYGKDAEEGSVVESKEYGTSTGSGGDETETKDGVKDGDDKGVSMKDYLAEKLKPGEEDKALSELISETLHKPKEEPVKKEQKDLVSEDEKPEKASEESYLSMMKGAVGSWFAKSEETQSPHVAEGEDLSKTKNSDAEVERVGQAVDEPRKQE